jgi:hypothetical protein
LTLTSKRQNNRVKNLESLRDLLSIIRHRLADLDYSRRGGPRSRRIRHACTIGSILNVDAFAGMQVAYR